MSSAPGEGRGDGFTDPHGDPVALDEEVVEVVPGWRRRRRLRQRLTMGVIVLLVVGAGLAAAGMFAGVIGPATTAAPPPVCAPAPRRPPALAPHQVQLRVLNGSGRSGLAGSTAAALRARRFVVTAIANSPTRVSSPAVVRYGARGRARAVLLARYVPGARLVQDGRAGADVDLVVGRAFTAVRTPAAPARPRPSATPATPATPTSNPTCTPRTLAPTRPGPVRSRPTTTPR